MFCWHNYHLAERIYAPPAGLNARMSEAMAEKLIFGYTTLVYQCKCGKIKVVEAIGKSQEAKKGEVCTTTPF